MTNLFTPSNSAKSTESSPSQSTKLSNEFTSLHSDEFFLNSTLLGTKSINLLSTLAETQDLDDSYSASKHQTFLLDDGTNKPLLSSTANNFFTSSVKTFNNFTTSHLDFTSTAPITSVKSFKLPLEDATFSTRRSSFVSLLVNYQTGVNQNVFGFLRTGLLVGTKHNLYSSLLNTNASPKLITSLVVDQSNYLGADLNTQSVLTKVQHITSLFKPTSSNHLNVRASVKDSIVNYNAFQKVFRSRFDESRSHSNWSNFQNLYQSQPFLNDKVVAYTNLLGKNRTSFYTTTFFKKSLSTSSNFVSTLYTQNNTQMYEFPFLDALQSDLIRYT